MKSRTGVREGIDLLADGSYFVAPPSTIEGKTYKWVEKCEPAQCPAWLASLQKEKPIELTAKKRVSELIRELFPEGRERNGEWETRCPFHDEENPSFDVRLEDGVFFCHSCTKTGSFETLYAKVKKISVHEARRILRPIPLWIQEFNKEHAIVKIGGKCVILNEEPHPTENWKTISFSSRADLLLEYLARTIRIEKDTVSIAKTWLSHPGRRQYPGIDFAPPPNVLKPDYYNLWQGFSVKPIPGDCSLYLDLVHVVAAQKHPGLNNYILGQMAQAVQQPAKRNGISLVFRGKQGTGKSVLVTQFGWLWGPHFFHARDWRQLTGNFNAHLKHISLLFADEVTPKKGSDAEGVLKALITEDSIPIEFKGKDVIQVKNYVRVMMATNKTWAVPAGLEERRFSVIEMGEAYMQDRARFRAIDEQMNKGGREAFLHYLLNYDISDIDLDKPYETDAQVLNKLLSMSSSERCWVEILEKGFIFESAGGWTRRITKHVLYNFYAMSVDKKEDSVMNQTAFWLSIRRLCPHLRECTDKGSRCVDVGTLQQCRDAVDRELNRSNHMWEPPEVETDVSPTPLPFPPSKSIELQELDWAQFRGKDESKGGEPAASV